MSECCTTIGSLQNQIIKLQELQQGIFTPQYFSVTETSSTAIENSFLGTVFTFVGSFLGREEREMVHNNNMPVVPYTAPAGKKRIIRGILKIGHIVSNINQDYTVIGVVVGGNGSNGAVFTVGMGSEAKDLSTPFIIDYVTTLTTKAVIKKDIGGNLTNPISLMDIYHSVRGTIELVSL